jgi:hypothetical protein
VEQLSTIHAEQWSSRGMKKKKKKKGKGRKADLRLLAVLLVAVGRKNSGGSQQGTVAAAAV